MTDKELHRLRRQDLLQLLLDQGRETERLRRQLQETEKNLVQSEATCERLKDRLNDKDAQIDRLKGRLDKKDAQLRELREVLEKQRELRRLGIQEAGSIAEAALRLNGVFEAAQEAVEQYLFNIRLQHDGEAARQEAEAETETEERIKRLDEELAAEEPEKL